MFSLFMLKCEETIFVNEAFWIEIMIPSENTILTKRFLSQFYHISV